MTKRNTENHEWPIEKITQEGIRIPGVTAVRPSMILAVCYNVVTRALAFVIDKTGLRSNQTGTYGPIEIGEGTRVQYAATLPGNYGLIAGARGFIAVIGSAVKNLVKCFARIIDQTTGRADGSMFFTPIGAGNTFETALVNRETDRVTNLLELGFTQVVAVPVLGGLVGVRADDPVSNRNRRLYFLPFAKLAAGEFTVEKWTASNPLATAISGLPWRMTSQNIGQVPARTPDGFECLDLRNLGKGEITSLVEQAIMANATKVTKVLGETMDPLQVVVVDGDGNTHFVPAQNFRAAVVEQAQAPAV